MIFHWSLNDSKSHQVSRTLLSIRVDLNNAVVEMTSIPAMIYRSFNLFSKPLETVPCVPTNNALDASPNFQFCLCLFSKSLRITPSAPSTVDHVGESYVP